VVLGTTSAFFRDPYSELVFWPSGLLLRKRVVILIELITHSDHSHLIMGLAAPVDSDPVAAKVNDDIERKESQATKDSQTASEYVQVSDTIIVRLLI
jgi:hypothetical protein